MTSKNGSWFYDLVIDLCFEYIKNCIEKNEEPSIINFANGLLEKEVS